MRRPILLLLTLAATPALGPTPASDVGSPLAKACQADFTRLCSGASMAGVGGAGCLRQNYISLAPHCRAALKATRPG